MLDNVTIVGNLTKDPEKRYAGSTVVASMRIATTQRRFDKTAGEWFDADSTFFTVSAWRSLGENVCASLKRGDRVVVVGRFRQRSWTPEGATASRTETEIDAEVVGADLAFAEAKPIRVNRSGTAMIGPDPQGGREAWHGPQSDQPGNADDSHADDTDDTDDTRAALGRALDDGPPADSWEVSGPVELTGAPA